MLGLINDNINSTVLSDSSISDLIDSIYGGINTDVNAITATRFDTHKIDLSVRSNNKVIIFAHRFGSTYATKVLTKLATYHLSGAFAWKSYLRLISIAPTASSATYMTT